MKIWVEYCRWSETPTGKVTLVGVLCTFAAVAAAGLVS